MMKAVETEVERAKRRITLKNKNIHAALDALDSELATLISELESSGSENKAPDGNSGEEKAGQVETGQVIVDSVSISAAIKNFSDRIVALKPVLTIKSHHKEYFTYVSKLGKTIDKAISPIPREIFFDYRVVEKDLYSLVTGYHKELSKKLKPENPQTKTLFHYEQLEKNLCEKEVFKALDLYEKHHQSLKLVDSEFKTNLCKTGFLKLVNEGKQGEAIIFLRKKLTPQTQQMAEEIGELIHSVCYTKELMPPKRLALINDFESILVKCLKQVRRAIRRLKGLPETSTFMQLIAAGLIALPQHLLHNEIWADNKNNQEIHITVDLPKDMVHHSMIYCPISKDVCDPFLNVPLLQNCGHIVGQLSVKKMVDANRGRNLISVVHFKCPTCPNQQTQASMQPILY